WLTQELVEDEFLGEMVRDKLIYYPTVTREPFENRGRITDLITSERLFSDIGMPALDKAHDRVMLCGSPQMLDSLKELLLNRGFIEGSSGEPGEFVIEKAFVEK